MGLDVGSALGRAAVAAMPDGVAAADGDAEGSVLDAFRPITAAPRTIAVTASTPSRTHQRRDIDPSVRATPDEGSHAVRGGHDGAVTLTERERGFLVAQRRIVLVTTRPDGRARPVPICFVVAPDAPVLYTPLDDKPKRTADPSELARVRDIASEPRVTLLADRWDEDWARLAWLRAEGRASLLDPGAEHAAAVAALRAKHPQYASHRLDDRPLIRVEIERMTSWGDLGTS
jgi:PPOX class probable F420-dependent enzyme